MELTDKILLQSLGSKDKADLKKNKFIIFRLFYLAISKSYNKMFTPNIKRPQHSNPFLSINSLKFALFLYFRESA